MPDEGIALARRLFLHVKDGGSITAMDLSRLVMEMEKLQSARDIACSERDRLAADYAKAQLDIVKWIEKAQETWR